ncbi:acyl carrier protein [Streptomyces sp. NPDC004284]|uniref:acyl carrier protein n=1 Tax=Streptomyces sp. NPDC004284 TaxID=3364695 RepID=UPI00367D1C7A
MAEITYETALSAVQRAVADRLQIPVADLTPGQSLAELGLDSIGAVELLARLESGLGVDLSERADALAEGTVEALARAAVSTEPADA